jgi:hypothetical protein
MLEDVAAQPDRRIGLLARSVHDHEGSEAVGADGGAIAANAGVADVRVLHQRRLPSLERATSPTRRPMTRQRRRTSVMKPRSSRRASRRVAPAALARTPVDDGPS